MRFELFLGLRYLKSKRRNFFISFITVISVAGVMVGVTALITVLAVMTGFDEELREKVLGNRSHLTVQRISGSLEDYERIADQIEEHPEVVAAAPFINTQALLISKGGERTGAVIMGIDPERQSRVTEFDQNLRSGEIRGRGVVLGSGVRNVLQVGTGSTVRLTTGRVYSHLMGYSADMKPFDVTGIYHSGMYEYDSSSVFLLLEDAQKLTGLKNAVSAIQVRLTDPFRAQEVGQKIINSLGREYWGETWIEQNRTFWYALKQEKIVMFVILTLVVVVAAFNIVSTLIMVVMEKRRDIGVLRSVGTPTRSIMGVFIFEGLTVGVVGTLLGLAGGITLAKSLNNIKEVIAEKTGVDVFSPDIYIFDKIPVSIQTGDVVLVTVSAVLICFLATVYPAWQAARLNPAECLRYE
jgi:lipoprotein-releasing system permease protein